MTQIEKLEQDALREYLIDRYGFDRHGLIFLEKFDPESYQELIDDTVKTPTKDEVEKMEALLIDALTKYRG